MSRKSHFRSDPSAVVVKDVRQLLIASSHVEPDITFSDPEINVRQYEMLSNRASPEENSAEALSPVHIHSVAMTTPEAAGLTTPPILPARSPSSFSFSHSREAELLMHYLDTVFALQFRFHVPSFRSGGRGWLLWLVTETKPLYHAALSLGALHQHSLLSRVDRVGNGILFELNDHHNRAIQELQKFLQSEYDAPNVENRGRKRELQVLACGVQLISFELFRGGINVWDPHLRALATLINTTYRIAIPDDGASTGLEQTAEKFLVGCVLWFDIIACSSTGQAPRVQRETHESLLRSGHISLDNIIGCKAWVALLIGEVARLAQESRERSYTTWKLVERGNPIREELERVIDVIRAETQEAFASMSYTQIILDPDAHAAASTRAVTLAFAHATQVYLYTTVTGAYPYGTEIRTAVQRTADAIREMRQISDKQATRSLMWPICIAGSMAESPSLQAYFHELIQELGEQAHDFGNSVTVLRILEKCWSYWSKGTPGDSKQGYSWLTAMQETGHRVLLV